MVLSRFYHDNIFVIKSRPITYNVRPDNDFCIHYLFLPENDPVWVESCRRQTGGVTIQKV